MTAAMRTAWCVLTLNPFRAIALLLFFVAISSNLGVNYYYGKWMGFSVVSIAMLGYQIGARYGWMAALKLTYVLCHICYFLLYPGNRYAPLNPYDLTALKMYFAESGFKLMLVLSPLLLIKSDRERMKEFGGWMACTFAIMNLLTVGQQAIEFGCHLENTCGGILANPSMNATMAAVVLPFVFKYFAPPMAWATFAATALAAFISKTSVGIGILAVFLVLHNWRFLFASPVILGLGWAYLGSRDLFSSGDRFTMWKFFMENWAHNKTHWLFGTGFGTFGVFSINLQNAHEMKNQFWWVWMHNDWLQAVFETGAIGAGLMLGTFLDGLRKLWRRREFPELQSLLLFGVAMSFNFPLHIGLSCAFGAWLILLALEKPPPHNINNSQGELL